MVNVLIDKIFESNIFFSIFIFLLASFVSFISRKLLKKILKSNSEKIRVDPTNFNFLLNSIGLIIYTIALIVIFSHIPKLQNYGKAIFASAGIFAAIIAFASQKVFSNLVSGIFILLFKPFKIGDQIEVEKMKGIVEEITLRHTILKDFENKRIIIPNSNINEETLINEHIEDERICKKIIFKVSYDANLKLAFELIDNYFDSHPLVLDVRSQREIEANERKIIIRVTEWLDFYIHITAWVWCNNSNDGYKVKSDALKDIFILFKENKIALPNISIVKNDSNIN